MLIQKGFTPILIIIIILIGIVAGLFLIKHQAIFNSQARMDKEGIDEFKDDDTFSPDPANPFKYKGIKGGKDKVEFYFEYYDASYKGNFKVDLSTTRELTPKTSFPNFGTGSSSPIIVENPQVKWDQLKCGVLLYTRISTADGSKKGPIRRFKVPCVEPSATPTPTIKPTSTPNSTPTPQPTPTPSSFTTNSIGYIGCSNTRDAVEGYPQVLGNKGLFWPAYETGGMSVEKWVDSNSSSWTLYDSQVAQYGQPKAVWVNLCVHINRLVSYEDVKKVIANLKTHSPGATVYISSVNYYEPKNLCTIVGEDGADDTIAYANQAVSEGLALAGPLLGPLTANNTQGDKCHPSLAGEVDPLGKQLVNFFDNL